MKDNRTSVKRSLFVSAIALALTAALLIGTTFAWFTSTASTGVNKIESGNLKVDIIGADSETHIDTLNFTKAAGAEGEQLLWEPGCRYLTEGFRIANKGNLALKWKAEINKDNIVDGKAAPTAKDGVSLLDVIDFYVVTKATNGTETEVAIEDFVGNLAKDAKSDVYYIKGVMQSTAGNDYQNLTLDGITITVYATQDTVENDSFDNQYDKDAPAIYPNGVTTNSFGSATSVYYYGTYGGGTHVRVATGDDILKHPAAVAYVDADGVVNYAADVYCAVANGATTIYCKENATLKVRSTDTNRTEDLTNDLTIYANGADFQYGDIAFNSTTTATKDITVKVYDAKNLYVWGSSPNENKALTVLMENCHNIGVSETKDNGRMFYISNSKDRANGTIHATLRNCSVEKSDSPVYMNADGSLTLESCTFTQCAVPVNNNYKSAGTRTDVVKDCKFIRCGCTVEMNSGISSYAAPIRFVKSGSGKLTVTLKNNTFNGTIGTNGDILLGDYRPGEKSFAFDATIDTANSVMVKSSTNAAYSYNGGTVNVLGN